MVPNSSSDRSVSNLEGFTGEELADAVLADAVLADVPDLDVISYPGSDEVTVDVADIDGPDAVWVGEDAPVDADVADADVVDALVDADAPGAELLDDLEMQEDEVAEVVSAATAVVDAAVDAVMVRDLDALSDCITATAAFDAELISVVCSTRFAEVVAQAFGPTAVYDHIIPVSRGLAAEMDRFMEMDSYVIEAVIRAVYGEQVMLEGVDPRAVALVEILTMGVLLSGPVEFEASDEESLDVVEGGAVVESLDVEVAQSRDV